MVLWVEPECERCLSQRALDVCYIQNNRGYIRCLLPPGPGCSLCCWLFCIPVVVAGIEVFAWPWAECSSRNLRIILAWASSCSSKYLIYHKPQVEVRVKVVAIFIGKDVGSNRAKIEECILCMRIKVIDRVFDSDWPLKVSVGSSGPFRFK